MARADLLTPQWKAIRKQVLARDGNQCVVCGQGPADGVALQVDHMQRAADGGDIHDMANLQTLCRPCHFKKNAIEQRRNPVSRKKPQSKKASPPVPLESVDNSHLAPAGISKPVTQRIRGDLTPPPRFASKRHKYARGSLAESFGGFSAWDPRPWQRQVIERALEVRANGSLCWPVVVVLTPRQVGKSVLLRNLAAWWGEQHGLTTLHVANRLATATEVWQPERRRAVELGYRATSSKEQPEVSYPNGGRYLVQAATLDAGVGFTLDRAIVDEAWRVPMDVVTQALSPAMSARPDTQLWLVSTAGDAESVLLRHYRNAGLDPESNVCLFEWSAPEGSDWLDEQVWADSTPHFNQKRLEFMRQQAQVISEPVFRSQYLNLWVHSAEGWMQPSLWKSIERKRVAMPVASVVAVEQDLDGTAHHLVEAGKDKIGRVVVRYHRVRTFAEVDAFMATRRSATLYAPPVYRMRLRSEFTFVGQREVDASMRTVMGLARAQELAHDGDARLGESVLSAQAHQGRDGSQHLVRTPGVSLAPMRAFLWASWAAASSVAGRPRVYTRSTS